MLTKTAAGIGYLNKEHLSREEKIKHLKESINRTDYIDQAIGKIADELIHMISKQAELVEISNGSGFPALTSSLN